MKLATDEKIIKEFETTTRKIVVTTERLVLIREDSPKPKTDDANTTTSRKTYELDQFNINDISNIKLSKTETTRTTQTVENNSGCLAGTLIVFGFCIILGCIILAIVFSPYIAIACLGGMALIIISIIFLSRPRIVNKNTAFDVSTELSIFSYQSPSTPIFKIFLREDSIEMYDSIFPIILDIRKNKSAAIKKWAVAESKEE